VSPNRRLGDRLAGTEVVPSGLSEVAQLRQKVSAYPWGLRSLVTVVLSCGHVALLMGALNQAGWLP
jgi:hypothetical protein